MPNVPNKPTFNPTTVGGDEYSVEINDANYSAESWKKVRYNGSITKTSKLNQLSLNDITSGKTAAAQKYSRNIYLGNFVVGMTDEGTEDNSLTHFPGFTYVGINSYLTINDDDTFSKTILEDTEGNFDSRKAYYRTFTEDFNIGTSCKIMLNDFAVRNNLRDRYNVFWNEGQLVKVMHLIGSAPSDDYGTNRSDITYISQSNTIFISRNNLGPGGKKNYPFISYIFKSDVMREIWSTWSPPIVQNNALNNALYTGFRPFQINSTSNVASTGVFSGPGGPSSGFPELIEFFTRESGSMVSNPEYRGLDKYFVTFIKSGSIDNLAMTASVDNPGQAYEISTAIYPNTPQPAIILEDTGSWNGIPVGSPPPLKDFNLLSTAELIPSSSIYDDDDIRHGYLDTSTTLGNLIGGNDGVALTIRKPLPQNYILSNLYSNKTPADFKDAGTLMFSRNDNSKPSILLKMNKEIDLPNGVGDKGFVVIPENLHPYIKDNLTYFLAKAGIPLGVDTIPARNDTRKKLT